MKKIIYTLAVAAAVAGCGAASHRYTVAGDLSPVEGQKYAYIYDYDTPEVRDSVEVVDGSIRFEGKADGMVHIKCLRYGRQSANFIVEGGDIVLDMDNGVGTGTPFNDGLAAMVAKMSAAAADNDLEAYKAALSGTFAGNEDNALGTAALWMSGEFADLFDELYASAGENAKNFLPVKQIVERNEKIKATSAGQMFTDFTIEHGGANGESVSLSDYVGRGKWVLVDFWASWCGPCRAEIPVIKEIYDRYRGDNFDVLGVAVWDERERSLKAAEELGITWNLILDAQYIPTDIYGINGIPQIILFAPDGTIVARDLRGDAMKAKVAEVLK